MKTFDEKEEEEDFKNEVAYLPVSTYYYHIFLHKKRNSHLIYKEII